MKKIIYILCGLLLLVQVIGCDGNIMMDPNQPGSEGNEDGISVLGEDSPRDPEQFISLYFLDPLGAYLFPLSFSLPEDVSLQDLLKHLSTGPLRKEWGQSPLPAGISIQDVAVAGERAMINLKVSSSFKGFEPGQEESMVNGIVYTLTSFTGIHSVEFMQDQKPPQNPFELLARQNLLTRRELTLNPLDDQDPQGSTARLWFSNPDVLYMVPVSCFLEKEPAGTHDLALLLVNALIEGPGDSLPLLKSFPEGTEVLSVKVVDQTVEIDFNRLFVENFPGGSAQEWAILNSLVLTLTEIPGIQDVQILVEGRKEDAALGHMYTAEPLVRGVVNWVLVD